MTVHVVKTSTGIKVFTDSQLASVYAKVNRVSSVECLVSDSELYLSDEPTQSDSDGIRFDLVDDTERTIATLYAEVHTHVYEYGQGIVADEMHFVRNYTNIYMRTDSCSQLLDPNVNTLGLEESLLKEIHNAFEREITKLNESW